MSPVHGTLTALFRGAFSDLKALYQETTSTSWRVDAATGIAADEVLYKEKFWINHAISIHRIT